MKFMTSVLPVQLTHPKHSVWKQSCHRYLLDLVIDDGIDECYCGTVLHVER